MSDAPRKRPRLPSEPEASHPPEPEAPRREFQFKPTEFERTEPPPGTPTHAQPVDLRQIYRAANAPATPPPSTPPVQAENDVHAILRANLAANDAKGLNAVTLEKRRVSRRKRDYWTLLTLVILVFGGAMYLSRGAPIPLMFAFSGLIFCCVALTWIMWGIMDDY